MSGLDEFAPDVDVEAELASEPVADVPAPEAQEPEPVKAEVVENNSQEEAPKEHAAPPPGFVPHAALAETRAQLKAARERAEAAEREYNERLNKIAERVERLQNPPPPVPKFEEDPASHLKHQLEATKQEIAPLREQLTAQQRANEQAAMEQRLTQVVAQHEAEFAKANPDYLDAVAHMQKVAEANLQLNGVDDPVERAQILRRDAMALAARALQNGRSPAEMVYQMAKNMGYSKPVTNQVDKVAVIEKGQKATPSMPQGGHTARTALENLASMDDDEVDRLVNDPDAWKKLIRAA